MEWLSELLNRELFRISDTPFSPISITLALGLGAIGAAVGPYIRDFLVARIMRSDEHAGTAVESRKFGTFKGVFIPSILTILGVIMYLRMGWVVGSVGLAKALLIVLIAHLITLATGLSVSSIATNRTVGAGGAYFIISRSLGAPAGAAIGIPLFFGQALSVTFYVVGFTESLRTLSPGLPETEVSIGILLLLTLITLKSSDLALKTQFVVMLAIAISLASFFSGRSAEPPEAIEWGTTVAGARGFADVFAVFFPAVTGIMAGVGMSGDLANPRQSLPRGTLIAILVGFIVYSLFPLWLSYNATNQQMVDDSNIVWKISRFPSLIYVGVWGATLSSAMGSILTAPRTLQALAADGLAPRIFSRGSGPSNEPRLGTIVTFLLALGGIMLGQLDKIASILTMFFLATYGFTNLACGLEKWAASPSFRPDFAVPSVVSLAGAAGSFYVMSIIDMPAMIASLLICGAIYLITQRRVLGTTYGDARHGIWSALVRSALYRLRRVEFHPLNWRPNLIIMGGDHEKRPHLLHLGSAIVQDRGIVTYFQLLRGSVEGAAQTRRDLQRRMEDEFADRFGNVFVRVDVVDDVYRGVVTVSQSYGVGSFEANTVMLGWPKKKESRRDYIKMLGDLNQLDRSLLIVNYDVERKFGSRSLIHIWWGGLQGNGSLMLLLAFLLKAHHAWRNADVEVMTIVDDEAGKRQAESAIRKVLAQARVEASPRVLLRGGRPIPEVIRSESQPADLAIIGFALPRAEEAVTDEAGLSSVRPSAEATERFFDRMNGILHGMPTTILVNSARHFKGEPVLFDAPPNQTSDGETKKEE